MKETDVKHVWKTLRGISVDGHKYVDSYREICQGILDTVSLSAEWDEGLRAVISGELVEWGDDWNCSYLLTGLTPWYWAIYWMASRPLNECIKEYCG